MMNRILTTCLYILFAHFSYGQSTFSNDGFFGNGTADVCTGVAFGEDTSVTTLVDAMCEKCGFKNRYVIVSCPSISNCQAVFFKNKPYILYNNQFLNGVKGLNFTEAVIKQTSSTNWKVLCILAHELGHHYNMHLINPDPNMTAAGMELEADEFAGRMLYMMGATLDDAQAAMRDPAVSDKDTYTHPGREKRLTAIEKGYNKAKEQFPKSTENTTPRITEDDKTVMDQIQNAEEVYKKGHFEEAYPTLYKYRNHRLFPLDDNTRLGFMLSEGKGCARNDTLAFSHYIKAAEGGSNWAQNNMGFMYYWGRGTTLDYTKALYWYKKSAEQGNTDAFTNIGSMYHNGKGVEVDYKESAEWHEKSADAGHPRGQYNLGNMYENGKGVKKDVARAIELYILSAKQGYVPAIEACNRLGVDKE